MVAAAPDSLVRSSLRDSVQWLTIDRPQRRNALNTQVVEELAAGVRDAMNSREVRAIVITGAGDSAFCAGADLDPATDGSPFALSPADPQHFVATFFKLLEDCRLPVIARINGHALAGGLGLACACDLAIASEDATFGTTETAIGLFPMMILPYLLRTGPRRRILELCITGARFTALEALAMDLVNYVVPRNELDAKLAWLLDRILDKSPTAIRLGKMGFHALQDMSLVQALDYAQLMIRIMAQTDDAKEGTRAFMEKRPPNWTGR
jgi:enoyl-CoA hydratase/carnithine racemase